ncbi:MAG: hydroxymethylbilane synthase [Bacteroidetes bacterium GWE2_29_8]|nr:MAG: hydroxymethylbilane synthase [Bacteroidetes bacterium GWE2_29_8]
MKKKIRIGTRGSRLALFQAEEVRKTLCNNIKDIDCEIIEIQTKGDIILDVALSKIGDKGLFTKEIENALFNNTIDIAVHSLKDLPTTLPQGLILSAVLKRAEIRDVLVSNKYKSLDDFTKGSVIATSSLRRRALLNLYNKDIIIKDIRGNIDTRLKKLTDNYSDGLIMAGAAIERLNLNKLVAQYLPPETFVPAASQGIIAIETRETDDFINDICKIINHEETFIVAESERQFLSILQGGCQVPIGCYTKIEDDKVYFTGFVSDCKGEKYIKINKKDNIKNIRKLVNSVADEIIKAGGKEIIDNIYSCI